MYVGIYIRICYGLKVERGNNARWLCSDFEGVCVVVRINCSVQDVSVLKQDSRTGLSYLRNRNEMVHIHF